MNKLISSLIIILILLTYFIWYKEKFQSKELTSPRILKVEKNKTDVLLEWYNIDKSIKEFAVIYVDIDNIDAGVWIQKKVKCDKNRCRLILRDMVGKRYKLTVLSLRDDNVSKVSKIIGFSNDQNYTNIAIYPGPNETAEGEDIELVFDGPTPSVSLQPSDSLQPSNKNVSSPGISNNTKKAPIESPSSSPAPAPPTLDCRKGVKLSGINSLDELEEAEIKPKCQEMSNLSELEKAARKRPFYYYHWEKIFE